uniref:Tetraspanin n=1 Tax=Amphilophus citrinellus TaxID=61819 RepID=A0A3Q0S2F0_AMPCI
MGVEGGMKCVKYLLFIFNFIFWICGLALVVLGIVVQVSLHNTYKINDPSASGAPIILIGVGLVIFFISFFGCCGAFKENYCMVTTMKCCGANSSADWKGIIPDGKSVPDSCCVNVTKGCGTGAMYDSAKVFQEGCTAAVEAALKTNILWVIVAAIVIAVLQLLGIVFACILMKGIRSGYEVM